MKIGIGTRFFLALVTLISVALLWMKFVERYLTIWGALITSLIIGALIFWYGGRDNSPVPR